MGRCYGNRESGSYTAAGGAYFLSEIGKVKIISSPHIAVCNNEEAKIMVGTRQPYATSTISQSDTTATTSWSAEFVDVGVTLTVTPTINNDGFVKMHIKTGSEHD